MIAIITAAVIVAIVAIVYICIRCGDYDDAEEFNKTKERLLKGSGEE